MRRTFLGAWIVALALALGTMALPAHAASDVVRALDVTYDVRADGLIDVTYELDWDFGEKGRRGIEFALVTSEVWDADPSMLVKYEITDIEVSSPTGAPAEFQSTGSIDGDGISTIDLRIGDPASSLDSSRETYVISFTMAGGLRTFDGVPELHLDVTSDDYPPVEAFTVTVQAASGDVPRARCLAGAEECEANVEGGAAMLRGSDVDAGDTITAVAELPAGQQGAEPVLEQRPLRSPLGMSSETAIRIADDGSADFTFRGRFALPRGNQMIRFNLPVRRGETTFRDRLFDVTGFSATDESGTPLEVRTSTFGGGSSDVELSHRVIVPAGHDGTVVILANWRVDGATDPGKGTASFTWPLAANIDDADVASGSVTWEAPGDIRDVTCSWEAGERGRCLDDAIVDGATARIEWEGAPVAGRSQWLSISFPSAAVSDVRHMTEGSRDSTLAVLATALFAGGIAAILIIGRIGTAVGRVRIGNRDQHYSDAPPGERGSEVSDRSFRGQIPVRFEPPDSDVTRAGFVLDRGFDGRHTAAALVQMAVRGSVQLGTDPFVVAKLDGDRTSGALEWSLFQRATGSISDRLSRKRMRQMNTAVERRFQATLSAHFRRGSHTTIATRVFHVAASLVLPALAIALVRVSPVLTVLGAIAAFLFIRGLVRGARERTHALNADGTALRQQVIGFRTYIRTAEADQLAYEADRDIYQRYLPWAVLFGETKRWTKVCQQLAAIGRIPRLDTSFMPRATSAAVVGRQLSRMHSRLHHTPVRSRTSSRGRGSSGGSGRSRSGGSSGFRSSRGGSGGGGSRAGSW